MDMYMYIYIYMGCGLVHVCAQGVWTVKAYWYRMVN